ncbi:MAG: SDR family NAD(P)-dependent oxidoreductase [Candidatus Curtissbacteria bacterium]|nr:SDR family NAD(P)-dependent oxidoreductase [Candidatus Curtissbacteria bacterium]
MVTSLGKDKADKTARELPKTGCNALSIQADVPKEKDIMQMVKKTIQTYGSIDTLINNAGIYPSMPVMSMALADFEKVLAVNLKSVFLYTKYVAEQMIKRGRDGRIINVTSIDVLHPSSVGLAHYDASKLGKLYKKSNAANGRTR